MGAGTRSVCGAWVGACACGVASEALVEDAGEVGVDTTRTRTHPQTTHRTRARTHTTVQPIPQPPPGPQTLPCNSRLRLPTAVGLKLGALLLDFK